MDTATPTGPAVAQPVIVLGRTEIGRLLNFEDYVAAVEVAFRELADGHATAPGPLHVPCEGGGFHVKAAGLPRWRPYVAVKLNGNFPHNRETFGLPTIQGAILLCDAERGMPLAILDSIEITIGRTGAATALGARFLARPDSRTVTICGCGEQARIQLASLRHVLPIGRVFAYDSDPAVAAVFADQVASELRIDAAAVRGLREATRQSDVIVTCTTSTAPFLGPAGVRPGTFIAAVGADNPAKQELTAELMASSKVVVDVLDQCAEMGDLHHALSAGAMRREDVHAELGDLVIGRKAGRTAPDEITILDTTGTGVQDVATAALVYERALQRGAGYRCDLT